MTGWLAGATAGPGHAVPSRAPWRGDRRRGHRRAASVVFDEAENRLWVQQALLALIYAGDNFRGRGVSDLLRNIHFFLQSLSWRNSLDVLVVAFLLYQLLKLIRGTQAVQLLLGLAVIFAVGWAAQLLHLRLLEFVFNNGTQAIVIAAMVLFQPELRRALDQVGRLGTVRAVLGRKPELALPAPLMRCCAPAPGSRAQGWRADRLRAQDRARGPGAPAFTSTATSPPRCSHQLIPRCAAARRGGDHPGEPDRRGRVRAAARGDAPRRGPDGHAPPRGARPHHAERRGGAHRERGDRPDQHRARRQDLPGSRPGEAARDAGHPACDQGGRVRTVCDAPSAAAEWARCAP